MADDSTSPAAGADVAWERNRKAYRGHAQARAALAARLRSREAWLAAARLLLAVVFVVLLWRCAHMHWRHAWVLAVPVLAFVPVAAMQTRAVQRRRAALRAVAVYEAGVSRMEDRWPGAGQQLPRGAHTGSLFAADLDLFGRQSLFALLSRARTRMGEDTLANWLLAPAPVEDVLRRQKAVEELRDRLQLAEDVAVLAEAACSAGQPEALIGWAEAPPVLRGAGVPWLAALLAAALVAAFVLWAGWGVRVPLLAALAVVGGVHMVLRRRVQQVMRGTDLALRDLELLALVLQRLERESFTALLLAEQQAILRANGGASRAIAGLRSLGAFMDARDNLLVKAVNIPLLYVVQLGFAAERWRSRHGARVRGWLTAVGVLEALLSLSTYSFEHPDDPFPEFAAEGEDDFVAEALGHPLLPRARCVRNDVSLTGDAPLMLISGSNMSGKSTLLRAVGLNAVLAMAGAPVCARRLRMTAVEVGASILVNDSLADGASRFYAEISRLRALCDRAAAHAGPRLLFLLDELLEGTNSHDRRIGAAGVLRALTAQGAMGIVTTHDLALAEEQTSLRLVNRHFEDAVRDGRMYFDYQLREGVVSRSNGVALMRLVGLDV